MGLKIWLHRVSYWLSRFISRPQRYATHQLGRKTRRLQHLGGMRWIATGPDPVFELTHGPLPAFFAPGTYLLRFRIHLPYRSEDPAHGIATVYINDGTGFSHHRQIEIPYLSGQLACVQLVLERASALRFDPIEWTGPFSLEEWELEPAPPSNAPITQILDTTHATLSYANWIANCELQPNVITESSATPLATVIHTHHTTHTTWHEQIQACTSPFVALVLEPAHIEPRATQMLAQRFAQQPQVLVVYADHDHTSPHGYRCEPFFKPDWSPNLFEDANYLGPVVWVLTTQLQSSAHQLGASCDAQQLLRHAVLAAAQAGGHHICHIPAVLVHAQGSAMPLAQSLPETTALNSSISLIIPTRDGYTHLLPCIESFVKHTPSTTQLELLVVNNQSCDALTLAYLNTLRQQPQLAPHVVVRVLDYNHPFNFSAINNMAALQAGGQLLGCVNDDIEATHPQWASEVAHLLSHPNTGAVGGLLLYPSGRVQHAGIVLGMGGLAGHVFKGLPESYSGHHGLLHQRRNVSAVTGAALFMRKALYQDLGGMDETLTVAYNDVDICLKAMHQGYVNVYTPHVRFLHHESVSRGLDTQSTKAARLAQEEATMRALWPSHLQQPDPYYSVNLSLKNEQLSLKTIVF